ncbi:hypothetical protein [Collimonas humicola]|uniref:hypothetical protein n=1 Tax=Collimonas humicola TaxID=2825886 RepID=UPI001B8D5182|nr:hypothetical protein [Collimonas humicola]
MNDLSRRIMTGSGSVSPMRGFMRPQPYSGIRLLLLLLALLTAAIYAFRENGFWQFPNFHFAQLTKQAELAKRVKRVQPAAIPAVSAADSTAAENDPMQSVAAKPVEDEPNIDLHPAREPGQVKAHLKTRPMQRLHRQTRVANASTGAPADGALPEVPAVSIESRDQEPGPRQEVTLTHHVRLTPGSPN